MLQRTQILVEQMHENLIVLLLKAEKSNVMVDGDLCLCLSVSECVLMDILPVWVSLNCEKSQEICIPVQNFG